MKTYCNVVLLFFVALCLKAQDRVSTPPPSPVDLFQQKEWRADWIATYDPGSDVRYEPKVTVAEVETLKAIVLLLEEGQNDAAIKRLLDERTDNSSGAYHFILANLLFEAQDYTRATQAYEIATSKEPFFRRAHKNLGLVLVQQGRYSDALSPLSEAIQLGSTEGRTYGVLAFCFFESGNLLAAREAYTQAIVLEPKTQRWQLGLIQVLLDMEAYGESIKLIETVLAQTPNDLKLWKLRANAQLGMGRTRDAATSLEIARAMGDTQNDTISLLGDIYMNEQMYSLARDVYANALAGDAQFLDFGTAVRAVELLVQAGSFSDARDLLGPIQANFPEMSTEEELRLLTVQASVQRRLEDPLVAARTLEEILSRDATRGDALLELAEFYWDQKRFIEETDELDETQKTQIRLLAKQVFAESAISADSPALTAGDTSLDDDRISERLVPLLSTLTFEKLRQAASLPEHRREATLREAQYLVSEGSYDKAEEKLLEVLEMREEARVRRFYEQVRQAASS